MNIFRRNKAPIRLSAVVLAVGLGSATHSGDGQTSRRDEDDATQRRPAATAIDEPLISDGGGVVPVRLVDDRLVVSCDISGPARRIPINLWLDFDGPFGLQLHNRAAAPLPAETADGQALPLTMHFPDFTLTVPRRELGDEEAFEEFTKYHSAEIGENALVGALGAQYLQHFDVVLDLPRNRIELRAPGGLAERVPGVNGEEAVVPISEHNDLVWLPVTMANGDELALAIGTSRFDTTIDRAVCDRLARPAGDVGTVTCGSHDLAPYVAFRPEDVVQAHPAGVLGVIGINLLQSFRVVVDRRTALATVRPHRAAEFPEADLAYFRAMTTEDKQLVETWLEEHREHRLGREAAELLLTLHLEEVADAETLRRATKWVNDTMVEDLRTTRMLDLMEEMSNEGETDLVIVAGEIGIESGRKDRYPDAVHKIHGRLGELLLERGEDREAWRHLLSAAFGLPEDGLINLNLGLYYERTGRYRRAFSRYIQAVIKEESGPRALEGLQRIDGELEDTERLSLEVIERMIAGKVRSDTAPVKFKPSVDEPVTNRTVLVEFFTNAYVGNEQRGAIGGALGNQRLLTHFEPEHAVFLSHHLPGARPDPLVNPLAVHLAERLGVDRPVVQVIDGRSMAPGAGRWRDAEQIYEMARQEVLAALTEPSEYVIDLEARLEGGVVSGTITVEGPVAEGVRVQVVVAERGVLFPGKSTVVVHRHLARGTVFTELDGIAYVPTRGTMTVPFERSLSELEAANAACLDSLEAAGAGTVSRMSMTIDPRTVFLVALVREAESGRVLQAAELEPDRPDEDVATAQDTNGAPERDEGTEKAR
ncbi:MAG: tetratricopeptide repeat protein [Planctomycetota bacterium]